MQSSYSIDIRPRRQATIPKSLLGKVGADIGDKLIAQVEGKKIILRPQRQIALDAFGELQRIVQTSGVKEVEIQNSISKQRDQDAQKRNS